MLCVLWFCLFHNCSSFVLFWRPKHSKHSQKKKKRKKKNTTELLGWVKSFAACLLCTRFSVNWTEKDLRRSEQQLLHSSPGDSCNPSNSPYLKKPRKRKKNNKNCKNLTSSSLSLSISTKSKHKNLNIKTPTNSPKQKAITKTSKTQTKTSPKLPPPHPQKSAAKECIYKIFWTLFCIYHLPQSLTKIHKPTKISQLIYTQRKKKKKKKKKKETKHNKTHKELKDRREKRVFD